MRRLLRIVEGEDRYEAIELKSFRLGVDAAN